MNSNLGRDKIWTNQPQIWSEIDKVLTETIGQVRIAQKVFPTVSMPNAPNVPNNQVSPAPAMVGGFFVPDSPPIPFLEISTEFFLYENQLANEATQHCAIDAVRSAARQLAQAEDLLIFNGQAAILPPGVNVTNLIHARNGLLGAAAFVRPVATTTAGPPRQWGRNTYNEVIQGIETDLGGSGHPGPFALVVSPPVHADTTDLFAPGVTFRDRLLPELRGGMFSSVALVGGALPAAAVPVRGAAAPQIFQRGLLVSHAGDPTILYLSQEAVVAFNQMDPQGNYRFRVFERIQFVAREPQALVRLEFN